MWLDLGFIENGGIKPILRICLPVKTSSKLLTCTHIKNSHATVFLPDGKCSWLQETERLRAGKMSP